MWKKFSFLYYMIFFGVFSIIFIIILDREKEKLAKADTDTNIIQGMVFVEGGSFQMGSPDPDKYDLPAHTVTLSDYYIGQYEITFKEYDRFCISTAHRKPDDHDWGRGNKPVMDVDWTDTIAFCNWKSLSEGLPPAYDTNTLELLDESGRPTWDITRVKGYRLPTEAEWEFAARGGKKSKGYIFSGSNNPDEVAWYSGNTYFRPQRVGLKKPNELGIYDMSGNLWEYCNDYFSTTFKSKVTNPSGPEKGKEKVVRGGCLKSSPDFALKLLKGNRAPYFLWRRGYVTGFRIARSASR